MQKKIIFSFNYFRSSIFIKFLNFSSNSLKSHLSLVLIPYLNLADLEGGFFFISLELGKIGFLLINLKHLSGTSVSGKYLEEFLCSE